MVIQEVLGQQVLTGDDVLTIPTIPIASMYETFGGFFKVHVCKYTIHVTWIYMDGMG